MKSRSAKPIYLNEFLPILPKNKLGQKKLVEWTAQCHLAAEKLNPHSKLDESGFILMKKLFDRYAVHEAQISERYFECDDVFKDGFAESDIYLLNKDIQSGADILKRTHYFGKRAFEIFQKIYATESKPDHLIHVTCTGYISPSAPQKIVASKEWNHETAVTHAYHMGCYAALPAIRLASALADSESKQVDIVHTEMCGLHMNPLAQTPEQTIVQTLFADGHIKYSVTENKLPTSQNFKIIAIHEKIVADSTEDMSWVPAPWGMQMNLSREVPSKIKAELKPFFVELLKKAEIDLPTAMKGVFAVHPGGPKIIEAVQEVLELSDEQTKQSKKILFERGNMSSATLPHVWNEILLNDPPAGTLVISFAFGPGLTLFGSVFEVC